VEFEDAHRPRPLSVPIAEVTAEAAAPFGSGPILMGEAAVA
jgi:hypothetical protein